MKSKFSTNTPSFAHPAYTLNTPAIDMVITELDVSSMYSQRIIQYASTPPPAISVKVCKSIAKGAGADGVEPCTTAAVAFPKSAESCAESFAVASPICEPSKGPSTNHAITNKVTHEIGLR